MSAPTSDVSVVFVMPPGGDAPWFSEHLGAAHLRAALAAGGISSRQFLPDRNVSLAGFARDLEACRPVLVGFTAYESNLRACRALARAARARLPEAIIAVGGPNATFTPEDTLAEIDADLCLRGAGEGTLPRIAQVALGSASPRRRLGELLGGIPSLVLRAGDGFVRTHTGDLSSFPAEHYRCLDDLPSPYQAGLLSTSDVGLLTARGCNQHCTYCSFAAVSGRSVRFHGVERVLDDLAVLRALFTSGPRRRGTVTVFDDAFTLAPHRARAICEGIIRRGLQVPLDCATRADHVDAQLLGLMKRAGFVGVSFGLESAVPRVLRAIGKVQAPSAEGDPGFDRERDWLATLRRAVAAARAAGLDPSVSVIGGLPGESPQDFRATLEFVASLGVRFYAHNLLAAFPGTPLYEERERHGIQAGREPGSGTWRTRHAYDVAAIPPVAGSLTSATLWEEAHRVADALCGRPRPAAADDESAWAVVIHGAGLDERLASWLRHVLAVDGTLVVVEGARGAEPVGAAAWLETLRAAGVPWGMLARVCAVDGEPAALTRGTLGRHRIDLAPAIAAGDTAIDVDRSGNCRFTLFIASAGCAPPAPGPGLLPPTAQIADGCRWWSGWRRCRHPRVLHVGADRAVRPCWEGPALGSVGDGYRELLAAGRSLGRSARAAWPEDACPIGEPGAGARDGVAEGRELSAQLAWVLRGDAGVDRSREGGRHERAGAAQAAGR